MLKSLAIVCSIVTAPSLANAQTTLRAVMQSDLKILDPIWTGATITQHHGYLIYDTLFALDADGNVQPQMVDKFDESADKLTYVFTLREGLLWHDSAAVTAEDCIASIKRWSARDPLGQKLAGFIDTMTADSDRTFTIKLKSQTGLLLSGLAKPAANVPFMMPKRIAETDPTKQITEYVGSGPFVFKSDEWKPGNKTVYVKFDKYKPRAEPPSGLAGGKIPHLDRVEWLAVTDKMSALNALLQGEIDYVEGVPHDYIQLLQDSPGVILFVRKKLSNQIVLRPNHLHKPFDNPKARQALWYALNQKDFLDAVVGNPNYYAVCKSYFICGTALASPAGMEDLLTSDFAKARALLKESGYDGTPIVLLQATDTLMVNAPPVAKALLEKAGFNVDMQAMDWQTQVARRQRKVPPDAGGWSLSLSSFDSAEIMDPIVTAMMNASCDKARAGWPCDSEIEKLRDEFARATTLPEKRKIVEAIQIREREIVTHIPLGQWYSASAYRKNVDGLVDGLALGFWNIKKKN